MSALLGETIKQDRIKEELFSFLGTPPSLHPSLVHLVQELEIR